MTARRRRAGRLLVVGLAALVLAGCKVEPDLITHAVTSSFPSGMVPATVDGLTAKPEPSAAQAFARVGDTSAVARGQVWTLRQDGIVVGSVQVSQLKGGLTTDSERVRAGIRGAINSGTYRWFKLLGKQWVGVQEQPQLLIYLWMPPRKDVYVVLQLKSTVADPERVVTDVIAYEEGSR